MQEPADPVRQIGGGLTADRDRVDHDDGYDNPLEEPGFKEGTNAFSPWQEVSSRRGKGANADHRKPAQATPENP
ncbi:hypothetical protein GCM10009525_41060 [Streptosporangium amethystogenes subsp. fukuiense]